MYFYFVFYHCVLPFFTSVAPVFYLINRCVILTIVFYRVLYLCFCALPHATCITVFYFVLYLLYASVSYFVLCFTVKFPMTAVRPNRVRKAGFSRVLMQSGLGNQSWILRMSHYGLSGSLELRERVLQHFVK